MNPGNEAFRVVLARREAGAEAVPIPPHPVPLGGDYWQPPFSNPGQTDIGAQGDFYVDTGMPASSRPGRNMERTGSLTSEVFTIRDNQRYLQFLVAGLPDINRLKIELHFRPETAEHRRLPHLGEVGDGFRRSYVTTAIPGGGGRMVRQVLDISRYAGLVARIRIIDESTRGYIVADDFRLAECPEPVALPPRPRPLWGLADTHAHFVASAGFNEKFIWGKPFVESNQIAEALPYCTPLHRPGGIFSQEGGGGHLVGGYPEFDGWPRFTTTAHQQAYVEWIKRAYDGGLRLVSMLAVNNELLADRMTTGVPSHHDAATSPLAGLVNDNRAIERQVAEIRRMVAFIDRQSGGAGRGWMQIASTPQETRRIIGDNKLALVLGVEVDSLGNWRTPRALELEARWLFPADYAVSVNLAVRKTIRRELLRLHGLGIRHVFPIHLTDNAFGGAAIYNKLFDALNLHVAGHQYRVENGWASGVRYRLDEDDAGGPLATFLSYGFRLTGGEPTHTSPGGHINREGLNAFGEILLDEMMSLGMIIDIDHMSEKATERTLSIAEARTRRLSSSEVFRGYPLVVGHNTFRELQLTADVEFKENNKQLYGTSRLHNIAHEGSKTGRQIERVRDLGGVVSAVLNQGANIKSWGTRVSNDSPRSSKTWAQSYLYLVDKLRGRGVAFASDINGGPQLPGPRFGFNAAYGMNEDEIGNPGNSVRRAQVLTQTNGVRYDSPALDFRPYRFEGANSVYDGEERAIWQAITVYKRGLNPWNGPVRDLNDNRLSGKAEHFAKGFFATSDEQLMRPNPFFGLGTGNSPWEQRAAFLVKTGQAPTMGGSRDTREVRRLYPKILAIWQRWDAMQGTNPPLTRSILYGFKNGRRYERDFDINLDGVAHYGMLPDFLQDLKNVGLNAADMTPLFRSAEDYVRMWEKCELFRQP